MTRCPIDSPLASSVERCWAWSVDTGGRATVLTSSHFDRANRLVEGEACISRCAWRARGIRACCPLQCRGSRPIGSWSRKCRSPLTTILLAPTVGRSERQR